MADDSLESDYIVPPLANKQYNLHKLQREDKESQTPDIWNHIAKNLALSEFYNNHRVVKQKQEFINNPEYLALVTQRSETFIHFILSEIEHRNLPTELAILPMVESSYFPKARSRAKAVGLWQFMPYTAKAYGLKKSYGYDGRHDVYASTIAALDYLERLNKQFDGDWLLTFAAYNAGPHRIKKALNKNTVSKHENSFWDLQIPQETRDYVPKILALCSIISDQNLSNELLYPISDESYVEPVEINKRISPSKLIQASGLNEQELCKLNPALRYFNNPMPDGYRLLVPKQHAQLVATTVDLMPDETYKHLNRHLIKNGESLSVIARQYGTSVNAIKETNNLVGNKIVAGRTLLVPSHINSPKQNTDTLLIQQTPSSTRDVDIPYFYVVTTGDSFWKIASRNNTTVDRLAKINGKNPDQPLQPGESILID